MIYAAKTLAATAIDLMTDAELLAAAKAEFNERTERGYLCPIEPDAVPIAI
jgi:aminobenzoyl-glutamate utilization protein B